MKMRATSVLSAALLAWSLVLHPAPQAPTVVSNEGVPLCYDPTSGKPVGKSMVFRGPAYVSPDGRRRAYAENELRVRGTSGAFDDCTNNSRLFVADAPGEAFRLVLLQVPSPYRLGNGIKIVDWSPDGRILLIEAGWFQYGSEAGETVPRRYYAESGIFSEEDSVPQAFSDLAGKNCAVVIQALGFSADGGLLLKGKPWFDLGDEKPSNDSCLTKEGLWLLDAKKGALSPLPNDYRVTHYAKVARSAAE